MGLSQLKVTSLTSLSMSIPMILALLVFCGPTNSQGFLHKWFSVIQNTITPYTYTPSRVQLQHRNHNSNSPSNHFLTYSAPIPVQGVVFQKGTKKCYGELGCLECDREWTSFSRPFNLVPEDREVVNVSYYYYNRKHNQAMNLQNPRKQHLIDIGFDPTLPTKYIVHDFLENGRADGNWPTEMARSLVSAGNVNVFVVNWEDGAHTKYLQAVANIRIVGLEIAHSLTVLRKQFYEFSLDHVHLIGHGLGAHSCGYAGEKLNGQIARITGLDPTGPGFEDMPTKVRLDPSDAKFVDVIHTEGGINGGFGSYKPCGHIDFYMNGGKKQPGCEERKEVVRYDQLDSYELETREQILCDHRRSVYYYIDAIHNSCKFVGHLCDSYENYLQGKCSSCGSNNSRCALLGLDAEKFETGGETLIRFDIATAEEAPYRSVQHFLIQIKLAFPESSDDYVLGQLKITLNGSNKSLPTFALDPIVNAKSGQNNNTLTYMIQGGEGFGLGDIMQ